MMRNEPVHGYLIHYRKYRERSHIVHLFTQEYGRMDGVLRQAVPPQYQPITLQATGKSALKNFTQLEILNQPVFFSGDAFFSGFYLNEILLRLCPAEEAMPETFVQYSLALSQLQSIKNHAQPEWYLRQILRQFEHVLLQELGYALDFSVDASHQPIQADLNYYYQLQEGFIPIAQQKGSVFAGTVIQSMQQYQPHSDFSAEQLQLLGKLYRQMISSLLGDRPLKSRQLWVQQNSHTTRKFNS